jgi:Probable cobalt transporter subunit (CbtB)
VSPQKPRAQGLEGGASWDPEARTLAPDENPTGDARSPEERYMSELTAQPIPLRDLSRWIPLAMLFMVVIFVVGSDQGQLSQAGDLLHEFMHDGRHLLSVPCH